MIYSSAVDKHRRGKWGKIIKSFAYCILFVALGWGYNAGFKYNKEDRDVSENQNSQLSYGGQFLILLTTH